MITINFTHCNGDTLTHSLAQDTFKDEEHPVLLLPHGNSKYKENFCQIQIEESHTTSDTKICNLWSILFVWWANFSFYCKIIATKSAVSSKHQAAYWRGLWAIHWKEKRPTVCRCAKRVKVEALRTVCLYCDWSSQANDFADIWLDFQWSLMILHHRIQHQLHCQLWRKWKAWSLTTWTCCDRNRPVQGVWSLCSRCSKSMLPNSSLPKRARNSKRKFSSRAERCEQRGLQKVMTSLLFEQILWLNPQQSLT